MPAFARRNLQPKAEPRRLPHPKVTPAGGLTALALALALASALAAALGAGLGAALAGAGCGTAGLGTATFALAFGAEPVLAFAFGAGFCKLLSWPFQYW